MATKEEPKVDTKSDGKPAESSITVPKPEEPENQPQKGRSKFITALIIGIILFLQHGITGVMTLIHGHYMLFVLSVILLVAVIMAAIAFFGKYGLWQSLLSLNKTILVILTFIFVIVFTSAVSFASTLRSNGSSLTSDELTKKDHSVTVSILVAVIAIVDYVLFLLLFIMTIFLFPNQPPLLSEVYARLETQTDIKS